MEIVIALAVGVMFGSGIWLILRPRTFQLITGLLLMSYAVNLFIFAMGRLWVDKPPITPTPAIDPAQFADPLPQGLVLTAIVIGFALMCFALVLVMQLVRRAGTDDALALRLVEPEPDDPVKPPYAQDEEGDERTVGPGVRA